MSVAVINQCRAVVMGDSEHGSHCRKSGSQQDAPTLAAAVVQPHAPGAVAERDDVEGPCLANCRYRNTPHMLCPAQNLCPSGIQEVGSGPLEYYNTCFLDLQEPQQKLG